MAGIGVKELGAFVGKMLREEGWLPPADAESLRSSLRAAEEALQRIARILDVSTDLRSPGALADGVQGLVSAVRAAEERAEAWVHAIAQKDSDIEHLRQQAEAAERDEDRAVIAARDAEAAAVAARDRAIAAEHRAEGLEEALKKAREAGLALLGWIAVCDKQGVVPNRNSVLAQNARAILDPDLARPRSEETPTSTACTVPNCHAGMLRSNGRDTVSCPVCDGVLTAEEYATFKQGGQTPNLGPAPAATDKETP